MPTPPGCYGRMPGSRHEDPARRLDVPAATGRGLVADPLVRRDLGVRGTRSHRTDDAKAGRPDRTPTICDWFRRPGGRIFGPATARPAATGGPGGWPGTATFTDPARAVAMAEGPHRRVQRRPTTGPDRRVGPACPCLGPWTAGVGCGRQFLRPAGRSPGSARPEAAGPVPPMGRRLSGFVDGQPHVLGAIPDHVG